MILNKLQQFLFNHFMQQLVIQSFKGLKPSLLNRSWLIMLMLVDEKVHWSMEVIVFYNTSNYFVGHKLTDAKIIMQRARMGYQVPC